MLEKHGENIEQAFLEYQEERIPRSADVQTSARMWGRSFIIQHLKRFFFAIRL